ncbi:hypothetical protein BCR41DRAFT_298218, partial [Lobosporangium transversale]
ETYGHSFHLKHYTTPKSCHQCHDVLWGSQKSGYECSICKYVAHRQCLDVLTISCQEQQGLRHSLPIYLLAHDKHEQRRWIRTIELHRKRAEASMSSSNNSQHPVGISRSNSTHTSLGADGTAISAAPISQVPSGDIPAATSP